MMRALMHKLNHYVEMGPDEAAALRSLPVERKMLGRNVEVISRGDRMAKATLVDEGWAIRFRLLPDGRRQVVNFMLPGDFFDMQVFLARAADHSVATVTPVSAVMADPKDVADLFRRNHKIAMAFWWAAVQEESVLREQIVRNGRRTARERVAHLLLELYRRAKLVGMTQDDSFVMPLSQALMSDALGLSLVHVNRVLRQLTQDGLIARKGQTLTLTDRKGLEEVCDYDVDYLHLDASPADLRLPFATEDGPVKARVG